MGGRQMKDKPEMQHKCTLLVAIQHIISCQKKIAPQKIEQQTYRQVSHKMDNMHRLSF